MQKYAKTVKRLPGKETAFNQSYLMDLIKELIKPFPCIKFIYP